MIRRLKKRSLKMAVAARTAKRLINSKMIVDAQYLADNILYMKTRCRYIALAVKESIYDIIDDTQYLKPTPDEENKYKDDIIAINKPYGLPVHAGPGVKRHLSEMLEEFAAIKNLKVKPELAHRLDKDSTGVLVLTRSLRAAQKVAELFHNRKVIKKYWALVVGVPRFEQGEIDIPVGEAKFGRWHKMTSSRDLIGKSTKELKAASFSEAVTRFKVLDSNSSTCSLLEINPQTGLKQQIRVHLAEALHCPIVGDHKFSAEIPQPQVLPLRMLQLMQLRGVKDQTDAKRKGRIRDWQRALIPLHLHARELTLPEFNNGKDIVITAPLPDYFQETLEKCKLHPKRKTMQQSHDENEFFRLRRLGISTNKIAGF